MKTQFDINDLLEKGKIHNELELERAVIAERKLRVLAKDNSKYREMRKLLRDIIEKYESKEWTRDSNITDEKIQESNKAEHIAEIERKFINRRKELIKKKLKKYNLNQQQFGIILGHNSKSYISELMNGVVPFSLRDLIIINRLLKIDLTNLVPTVISLQEKERIAASIKKLNKPNLKLSTKDFVFES